MLMRRDILRAASLGTVATTLPGVVFAKASTDARFVLVVLRGAADGLAIAAFAATGGCRTGSISAVAAVGPVAGRHLVA